MKIRCSIPLSMYLVGSDGEHLSVAASYEFQNLKVSVTIAASDVLSMPADDGSPEFFGKATGIDLLLEELPEITFLAEMVRATNLEGVIDLLIKVANRVMLAIRNFGIVTHLREFHPSQSDREALATRWNVEFFDKSSDKWGPLVAPSLSGFMAVSMSAEPFRELRVARWPDIEEAMSDELKPAPEQEFFANCLEHLRERNFRLALVESIICLEIVLSQFLENYLRIEKNVPAAIIKQFLQPSFSLSSRIAGLLTLTLDEKTLDDIEISTVLKAVNWRNKIAHGTGHIPEGIDEGRLRKHISAVLLLALTLGRKRDQLAAEPGLRAVAETLATALGVPAPTMSRYGRHVTWAEYFFLGLGDRVPFPSDEQMNTIAEKTGQILRERDSRFDPAHHLYVKFMSFPWEPQWSWVRGKLVQTSKGREARPQGAQ